MLNIRDKIDFLNFKLQNKIIMMNTIDDVKKWVKDNKKIKNKTNCVEIQRIISDEFLKLFYPNYNADIFSNKYDGQNFISQDYPLREERQKCKRYKYGLGSYVTDYDDDYFKDSYMDYYNYERSKNIISYNDMSDRLTFIKNVQDILRNTITFPIYSFIIMDVEINQRLNHSFILYKLNKNNDNNNNDNNNNDIIIIDGYYKYRKTGVRYFNMKHFENLIINQTIDDWNNFCLCKEDEDSIENAYDEQNGIETNISVYNFPV